MDNGQRLVTIVMCVYNGQEFLTEQIESILNQTYSNLELLILDDGSSDASVDLVSQFIEKDKRVKLTINPTNLGFNKNFEKGIRLAAGEFIAISDQDDIWMPNKVELLLESIADASLIYSNSTLIDEFGGDMNRTLDSNLIHVQDPSYKSFLDINFLTGHTCLFKKELIKDLIPFPAEVFYYDWWMGFVASYTGRVKYLDVVLTKYRIHNDSVMRITNAQTDERETTRRRKLKQVSSFSRAEFVNVEDRRFIEGFLSNKRKATNSLLEYIQSYLYLLKHHRELYACYRKGYLKKMNFLRKQCLR